MIFGVNSILGVKTFVSKIKWKLSQNALIKCLSFYLHPKIEQI
jgi:hypothetical protein